METGLRARNIEGRRQRILQSARTIILESGPDELSMRLLAKEAGLSVATLYNLFGSKDEIITALAAQGIEAIAPRLVEHSSRDSLDALRSISTLPVSYILEQKEIFKAIIAVGYSDTSNRMAGYKRQVYGTLVNVIAGILEAAREDGVLEPTVPARLVAAEIFYSYRIALEDWACDEIDDGELQARIKVAVNLDLLPLAGDKAKKLFLKDIEDVQEQAIAGLAKRFSVAGEKE